MHALILHYLERKYLGGWKRIRESKKWTEGSGESLEQTQLNIHASPPRTQQIQIIIMATAHHHFVHTFGLESMGVRKILYEKKPSSAHLLLTLIKITFANFFLRLQIILDIRFLTRVKIKTSGWAALQKDPCICEDFATGQYSRSQCYWMVPKFITSARYFPASCLRIK